MIIVTGAIGSGTSLVTRSLMNSGVDFLRGATSNVNEDPRYIELIRSMKLPVLSLLNNRWWTPLLSRDHLMSLYSLIDQDIRGSTTEFGFKSPFAAFIIPYLLPIIPVPSTIIYVYRDLYENVEAWQRKKEYIQVPSINVTFDYITCFHIAGLRLYRSSTAHRFYAIHIRDFLGNYEAMLSEIIPGLCPYPPLDSFRNPKLLLGFQGSIPERNSIHPVYEAMEKILWRP